jgi:hypothetical protein
MYKADLVGEGYLVTPRVTLAGTASGLIQKEIHDMMTIRQVGTYVWNR